MSIVTTTICRSTGSTGVEAVRLLREEGVFFDFVFFHFGSVDAASHVAGWMSFEYLNQLQRIDGWLGWVLDVLPPGATIVSAGCPRRA
ncbi:MAG: alkaline phosphatase family protein [Roseiflexus sp.]|nr:alkaline phosphatase family protein [Roseiflexus sp.]